MTKSQIQAVIADIEARFPGLRLQNRYAWTHKVAYACYLVDKTVGQKRADPGRPISDDTIGWANAPVGGGPGHQVNVQINAVDLLDGGTGAIHWDENPGITDQLFVVPLVTDIGTGPSPIPVPQPPSQPIPVVPGREEALDELNFLDNYYKAPEGLQRPDGLSLGGRPDFLGIAAWYLDVYQQGRVYGKTREQARAVYVSQIRHSDEWRQKHPGETP